MLSILAAFIIILYFITTLYAEKDLIRAINYILLVIIILGMFIIPFALVIENFIAEDGVVEGLSRAWNYLSCSFLPMFFILLIIIFLISPKENKKN